MGKSAHFQPQKIEAAAMGRCVRIALLVRHWDQLAEALRTGERLSRAGLKVAVFFTDGCLQNSPEVCCGKTPCSPGVDADCFSCDPADVQRFGLNTASVRRMAEMAAGADLLISF